VVSTEAPNEETFIRLGKQLLSLLHIAEQSSPSHQRENGIGDNFGKEVTCTR
jgi:hypothetical protein